jgi:hypothetical protein
VAIPSASQARQRSAGGDPFGLANEAALRGQRFGETKAGFLVNLFAVKATIEFDDDLYRQLKAAAALRGAKIKDLVAEGVRLVLRGADTTSKSRRIKLPAVRSRKPGTLRLTNELIAEYEANVEAQPEE